VKLIADSGSTGTDWVLLSPDGLQVHHSAGLNPNYSDQEEILLTLDSLPFDAKAVSEVHFYGSGIGSETNNRLMMDWLQRRFPQATCSVANDLLGAALALTPFEPGIVAILGTGCNSCVWDGQSISDDQHSLGYLLGDEGSGFDIGRRWLSAHFYGIAPDSLSAAFSKEYAIKREQFIGNIYNDPNPNRTIASYARFVVLNKNHAFCNAIINESFSLFIERYLSRFRETGLPVHFVGSIAFYLQDELTKVLENSGFTAGQYLQAPIDGLLKYHQTQ
jgi:N-acetylglucosamine kinase-like BadF-type ATPase